MIPLAVIGRYGRSLAEVALEQGEEPVVTRDLSLYKDIFLAVPDLLTTFDSPAVRRESKEEVLRQLIAAYPVIPTTANFLRILLDHNRIRYYSEIFDLYQKTVNERTGKVTAQVTTAGPISEENLTKLSGLLSEVTGKVVTLAIQTDPGLLGGLMIQIGSTVYDGSVRTQLAELKQRLMA